MVEITVPIGPQHPALKEPVNFKVFAEGETIVRLELDVSYNHRGIEKAAEQRDFIRVVPLLERVCGICSHSHGTVFVKGVEEIMGLEIPPRAQYIRTIIAELERLHSHLLWLGVAAHEIGFNTLFMWTWGDREVVQDILEELTGNRVNYGMNEIGGVRRDIPPSQVKKTLSLLPKLDERLAKYPGDGETGGDDDYALPGGREDDESPGAQLRDRWPHRPGERGRLRCPEG